MNLEELSKRDLIELYKASSKQIREMQKKIKILEKQVAKLSGTREVPSFVKTSVEHKIHKSPGAKEGHEGATRPLPEKIDEKKEVTMKRCPRGHRISKIREKRKRIVEDVEFVRRAKVVEYELQGYWCKTCKKKVFPRIFDAMPRFRLGMNFCNYVCERKFGYRMPFNLIQKDLLKNFGLKVSQATLVNAVHAVASLLGSKYEEYRRMLRSGRFVHIDETGWRVEGANRWLWKFRSKDVIVTVVDKHRSHDVPENVLGKTYKGTKIHDGFPAYNLLTGEHQQCWTHITRQSRNARKKYPDSQEVTKFHEALKRMYRDAKRTRKSKSSRKRFEARMKRLLSKRHRNTGIIEIKAFLKKHFDELFVFVAKRIEGTNNAAEQSIRNDVVIRKISGGNRSEQGMNDYAVLSSVMQTCQLQNTDFSGLVRNELKAAADG